MSAVNIDELVKRISKLARQNQELEEHIKKLEKQAEKQAKENEKQKALLEQLAPAGVANMAISDQRDRSLKFNMATVLFANIHGFSSLIQDIDSSAVMDELDEILYEFEQIVLKYKIEKIKTIGDAFMCAGGIPVKNITNPVDVVMAAIEMRGFLHNYQEIKRGKGNQIWDMKIGIHTGPVTASVTGKKKINYDIKGDTVNTASRVETVSRKG
jgi:adenylate cyclase